MWKLLLPVMDRSDSLGMIALTAGIVMPCRRIAAGLARLRCLNLSGSSGMLSSDSELESSCTTLFPGGFGAAFLTFTSFFCFQAPFSSLLDFLG